MQKSMKARTLAPIGKELYQPTPGLADP